MRNSFINAIMEASTRRDDIFVISGDAGLGVFDTFKAEHPDRFLNLGVAEQNMASFAAGLAMTGYKVVLYNIIPFLLYRCYEQVRNDICYQNLPIILAGIGSGLTYSPQGMTHYSVEDLGIARTLPNLSVLSPIDPVEARLAAGFALSSDTPVYVRLAKRGEPEIHTRSDFDISIPQVLSEGSGTALLFHGSIGEEVLRAALLLKEQGIVPRVISVPLVQPLNFAVLGELLGGISNLVTVEEHYHSCGLGSTLREFCTQGGRSFSLTTLGIAPRYIHEVHDNRGMRKLFGIDAEQIAAAVQLASECGSADGRRP